MSRGRFLLTGVLGMSLAAVGPAHPGEGAPAQSLLVELNGLEASPTGCRLTFVAENRLGIDLARAVFEIVLFDGAGLVDRLAVIDFRELPDGRTRVRQFDIEGADCTRIGRILVNDSAACEGVEASLCMARLETRTKSSVRFGS